MVNPLSYFLFQPVHHDLYNNGHGMCYPCGIVHIKEHLLLIEKSSHVVATAGFLSCCLNDPLQYV